MGSAVYKNDDIWLEEFPDEKPPKHVLNGVIFSILSIYDLYLATLNTNYLRLFYKLFKTLKRNIYLYDLGFWSRYDIDPLSIAEPKYNFLNSVLLYVVSRLTFDYDLLKIAKRWMLGYRILKYPIKFFFMLAQNNSCRTLLARLTIYLIKMLNLILRDIHVSDDVALTEIDNLLRRKG